MTKKKKKKQKVIKGTGVEKARKILKQEGAVGISNTWNLARSNKSIKKKAKIQIKLKNYKHKEVCFIIIRSKEKDGVSWAASILCSFSFFNRNYVIINKQEAYDLITVFCINRSILQSNHCSSSLLKACIFSIYMK